MVRKGKIHVDLGNKSAEVTDEEDNHVGTWSGVTRSSAEEKTGTKRVSDWELDGEANGFTAEVEY